MLLEYPILIPFGSTPSFLIFYNTVSIFTGKVTTIRKMGSGCFHNETLIEAMTIAVDIGKEIHEALRIKLQQESQLGVQREKFGFIK